MLLVVGISFVLLVLLVERECGKQTEARRAARRYLRDREGRR